MTINDKVVKPEINVNGNLQIAIVNPDNGNISLTKTFDTYKHSNTFDTFIDSNTIPHDHIVLATYNNKHSN